MKLTEEEIKEYLKPNDKIYLISSDYLKVIQVGTKSGNLALSTSVTVCTKTNTTEIEYKVRCWNDNIKSLNKTFTDYTEAHKYYIKMYRQYKKDLN